MGHCWSHVSRVTASWLINRLLWSSSMRTFSVSWLFFIICFFHVDELFPRNMKTMSLASQQYSKAIYWSLIRQNRWFCMTACICRKMPSIIWTIWSEAEEPLGLWLRHLTSTPPDLYSTWPLPVDPSPRQPSYSWWAANEIFFRCFAATLMIWTWFVLPGFSLLCLFQPPLSCVVLSSSFLYNSTPPSTRKSP